MLITIKQVAQLPEVAREDVLVGCSQELNEQ